MSEQTMPAESLFNAWINPLQFLAIDQPSPGGDPSRPSLESVVVFLCRPGLPADSASLAARYREIAGSGAQLFAAPAEERILEKLVWPLRHAKASYMLGNYFGTIALSGMVAEMVTMLLFDITEAKINQRIMTESDQEALFGRPFEKLDQYRRVEVLRAYGIIDDQLKTAFDVIRTTRRKYLHLWSHDLASAPVDALKVYNAAILLVVRAIGQDIKDGGIVLNPALVKYLQRSGLCGSKDGDNEAPSSIACNDGCCVDCGAPRVMRCR